LGDWSTERKAGKVVAFVQLAPTATALEDELAQHAAQHLAP